MTHRERTLALLHYQPYDRLPIVHFGWWWETVEKWVAEGHFTMDELHVSNAWGGDVIAGRLGFDFGWDAQVSLNTWLTPGFETAVLEELPDGGKKVRNSEGVVVLQREGANSIPAEIDHLLKDRASWKVHYQHRYQFSTDRLPAEPVHAADYPRGLYCGSLLGQIRNVLGVEGLAYLYADDEALFVEIIDTVGEMTYRTVEAQLARDDAFDFAHFWEDICFKNGPLVVPSVFDELVGPHYRRITDLLKQHGITLVSLDCDGLIDRLIPTWLANGVNIMFPIEVGTWEASIAPWRAQCGKEIRGIGGMDKKVFADDYAAIDAEIERLKPLVALGGYLPCPDHRIPPDAKWENVQYYCEKMRQTFGD